MLREQAEVQCQRQEATPMCGMEILVEKVMPCLQIMSHVPTGTNKPSCLGELPDHVDAQTHWIKFWFIIVFIGPINTFDVLKPVLTPGTLAQHESTGNAVLYSALSRQQDRDLAWRISRDYSNQNPSEASRSTPSAIKHEVKTRNERCCWSLTLQILGFCHFQDLCLLLSMISINTSPPKAILEDGYNRDVA